MNIAEKFHERDIENGPVKGPTNDRLFMQSTFLFNSFIQQLGQPGGKFAKIFFLFWVAQKLMMFFFLQIWVTHSLSPVLVSAAKSKTLMKRSAMVQWRVAFLFGESEIWCLKDPSHAVLLVGVDV